jgi:NAD(P)-dependent dehydrogenase (short-subunit alcohol dehydrogenase family)
VNSVSIGLVDRADRPCGAAGGDERWLRKAPLGRLGRPEDVADAYVFLASPLVSWVTGHELVVDGGMSTRPTW